MSFSIIVGSLLLAACQQPAVTEADKAGNAAAAPGSNTASVANPLGAPISGDQAKALMHDRHERMEEIGDAFKAINRALKSDQPDVALIQSSASKISTLAPQVSDWFPPGTGPDVGKTEARAEIWQKPEDFAAKTRTFQAATKAFEAAAKSGDVNAIKSSFEDLGKSCKACHDPYRKEH